MIRVVRRAVYLLALILLGVPSVFATDQPFTLTLALPREPFRAGKPLLLEVTVKNTGSRLTGFVRPAGPDAGMIYKIEARDARGEPAPRSASMRELEARRAIQFQSRYATFLEPGESFTDRVAVTKLYNLSQPGEYTISVSRKLDPHQNLGRGIVRSNTITVTVVK